MQNKSEEREEGIHESKKKSVNNKITCPFFDELDAVLGHPPASAPPLVLDVSAGGTSVEPSEERDDDRRYGRFIYNTSSLSSNVDSRLPVEASQPESKEKHVHGQ